MELSGIINNWAHPNPFVSNAAVAVLAVSLIGALILKTRKTNHSPPQRLPESEHLHLKSGESLKQRQICDDYQQTYGEVDLSRWVWDKCRSSGQGTQGKAERLFFAAQHEHFHQTSALGSDEKRIADAEFLCSRIMDREPCMDEVYRLSEGYYRVQSVHSGGGAYAVILTPVGHESSIKVAFRGTALRLTAEGGLESGLNDLQPSIGISGIGTVWPGIHFTLKRLAQQYPAGIHVLGKSLGGAHAQQLVTLLGSQQSANIQVTRLDTLSSVGVGRDVYAAFNKNDHQDLDLLVVRAGLSADDWHADAIPCLGGKHVGHRKQLKRKRVAYYAPGEKSTLVCTPVNSHGLDYLRRIAKLFASFGRAHVRQSTLVEQWSHKFVDEGDVEEHLALGDCLETPRLAIAWALHILSLRVLWGRSFNDVLNEQLV